MSMKQILFGLALIIAGNSFSQSLGDLIKNVERKDTSKSKNASGSILNSGTLGSGLSTTDIRAGLKQALQVGAKQSVDKLSAADGFFKNAAIKILLPPEAQKMEKTLRSLGFDKQVDAAILSMNRAAEDAAKSATPIFINAITQMNFQDAMGILNGGDTAATKYMRGKTTPPLTSAFKPVIQQSLAKTEASKDWEWLTTAYNKVPFVKKMNTDLPGYVTDKALTGIFYQLAIEEKKIRQNPAAQTTDLLKKVFGQ